MGTIPLSKWQLLLEGIQETSWRHALSNLELKKQSWFTEESKALFYQQVTLLKYDRFLDIGAGSGVISAKLSGLFKQGISLDYVSEAVQFMGHRYRQDGIKNVRVVRGDGCILPVAEKSVDLVVVNGVLEWVAEYRRRNDCRSAQLDFLKGIARCLCDGGKVAIAIENRWNISYLCGKSPHGEPPFVALLPRPIARLIHLLIRRKDYRTYIYGHWGYHKLLQEAGFSDIKTFLAVPNYYRPKAVCSIDPSDIRTLLQDSPHFNKGRLRGVRNILSKLGLLGYVWPAFFLEAKAG